MSGVFILIIFFALMLIGIPIGFSMGAACLLFFVTNDIPYSVIPQVMTSLFENFPFLAIPFFALAGQLMNNGGITDRIFAFAKSIVGHIPGSLGHANVLASMIFAGMSGSAVADSAGLGTVEIKAMREEGYDLDFSAAVTAASSTIGPILPPSIPFVLYGAIANCSVGALFIGGAVPGLLMGFLFMVIIYLIAKKRKFTQTGTFSLKVVAETFIQAFFSLLTPLIILGGIILGIATPTESAVFAVLYSLLLGLLIYRESNFREVAQAVSVVARSVGMIAFLSCTAFLFGWILTYEQLPQEFANLLVSLSDNKYVILLIINLLLLMVGCFMDTTAAIVVLVPIFMPTLSAYGIDKVHFGVMMTLNLMIGLLTPPVGLCIYLISDIAKVPFESIIKATLPYMAVLIAVLLIITYWPDTVTWLPRVLLSK